MNKKLTLLLLAAGSIFTMKSQVLIFEDFNEPFNPTTAGWEIYNNSAPSYSLSWTQGNQTGGNGTIPAYNGATDDFYMADFMALNGTNAGGISAWLMTPLVTIYDGAILQFATRTLNQVSPNIYPDRLQIRMSPTGNTVIPTGTTNVGSFTTLMLDINPNLTTNNASAVNNGSVNGYPFAWTVYSLVVTGVTGTVQGRFAFHYFVDDGGIGGNNSRLVGLDAVRYTLPCGAAAMDFTTCAGATSTLNASGGIATTTYSWSTGATTPSITVNPSSTTVYTLYPSVGGSVACTAQEVTVTVGSGVSVNAFPSSQTVCAGSTVTLTAITPGNYAQWVTGLSPIGSGSMASHTPTGNTTYSVVVGNGSFPAVTCTNIAQVTVSTVALPTVSIVGDRLVCRGTTSTSATFSGSGASLYLWEIGTAAGVQSSVTFTWAAVTPTTVGSTTPMTLTGLDATGCTNSVTATMTVALSPTVSASATKTLICTGNVVTVNANATAGSTFSWSAGSSTVANSTFSYSSTGVKQIGVTAISSNGCAADAIVSVSVSACTGIEKADAGAMEAAVFPNPFTSQLTLSGFNGTIVIYNALGQQVLAAAAGENMTISTSELPKGAYILKAFDANGSATRTIKLVKN